MTYVMIRVGHTLYIDPDDDPARATIIRASRHLALAVPGTCHPVILSSELPPSDRRFFAQAQINRFRIIGLIGFDRVLFRLSG
jgi:hypothetical protein